MRRMVGVSVRVALVVALLSALQAAALVAAVAVTGAALPSLACSVVAVLLVAAVWVWARRRAGSARPGVRWAGLVVATLVVSTVAYLLPHPAAPARAGAAVLRLPDGDELAVRRYGPAESTGPPLVLVHGGPGVPFSRAEEAVLADAAGHRPVVSYDQAGTGGSSHLADPAGYRLRRSVGDLDQVVAATSGGKVVLLGHSWGALVALTYATRRPEHVAALVFTSPGPFPWRDGPLPAVAPQHRLGLFDQAKLYAAALAPRNLFAYTLTAVDPTVAHWFAGDAEMDRRFAALYRRAALGTTCDGKPMPAELRVGFYAAQVPQLHPDGTGVTRDQLRRLDGVPVLVVRGSCDYIGPRTAATYRDELSGTLTEIPRAGHNIADDRPGALTAAVGSFLRQAAPAATW